MKRLHLAAVKRIQVQMTAVKRLQLTTVLLFCFVAQAADVQFVMPVEGSCRVSGGFGARKHPLLGTMETHGAYDFAPTDDSAGGIVSPAAGQVTGKGVNKICGNYLEIKHANGLYTHYCHMKAVSTLNVGQAVRSGQRLGLIGTSGRSTGPHLHWVVKTKPGFDTSKKSYIDPVPKYLKAANCGGAGLSGAAKGGTT